jgi:uncharacterized membrane protein YeaQ/YmgE (transglycosylase-associated protein family)
MSPVWPRRAWRRAAFAAEAICTRGDAMFYLVWVILIGILAGWIAGQLWKGSGFGVLGDLIVGVIGSLLGSFIFGLIGIGAYGLIGRLVISVLGALILLWLIRLIKKA